MHRRDFINYVGLGALASSLPIAIAACQPESEASSEATAPEEPTAPRQDGFAVIGTVAELEEAGFIADKNFLGTQVLVVPDPADASTLIAVDSLCTHKDCNVAWDSDQPGFVCPCHGAVFNPDGTVAQGPATDPLGTYPVKIEGDQVLVQVT